MYRLFIFICFIIKYQLSVCGIESIYFRHLNVNNGLSQTTVNSIYQDEFGLIWIGTKDGLNRYDGNNIKVYRSITNDPNSLFGNYIQRIEGDRDGSLFLHCKNGLVKYDIRSDRFSTITDNGVYAIHYGQSGLWVGRKNRIELLAKDEHGKDSLATIIGNEFLISSLYETVDKKLYVGTKENGLFCIENNRLMPVIEEIGVSSIFQDSNNHIWIGTRGQGLYKLMSEGKIEHFLKNKAINYSLPDNYVRCINEDNQGNFWIGTMGGLAFYNIHKNQFHEIESTDKTSRQGNFNSNISLFKDQQGSIWCGTYHSGLRYFNPDYEFYHYYFGRDENLLQSKQLPTVGQVVQGCDGSIYVNTEGEGLKCFDKRLQQMDLKDAMGGLSISAKMIKSLFVDSVDYKIWVGTVFDGLYCIDRKKNKLHHYKAAIENGLSNNSVRRILAVNEQIYLATHKGLEKLDLKSNQFEKIKSNYNQSFEEHEILDLLLDKKKQVLWFCCSNGLYCYNLLSQKIDFFSNDLVCGGNPYNKITCLLLDQSSRLWLGTANEGLFYKDADSETFYKFYNHTSALNDEYIVALNQTKKGSLIVGTNTGLYLIDRFNQGIRFFDLKHGFPMSVINEFGISVLDDDIFIGGIDGLISFKEDDLARNKSCFLINFTKLEVNNQLVNPIDDHAIIEQSLLYDPKLKLQSHHKTFSIEFATTNYVKSALEILEYKLGGFDKEWIQPGERRLITYTNLSPGKYTLRIRSTDDSEVLVPQKSMDIIVSPPFYQTYWAYLIYGISILLIIYLLLRDYTTRVKLRASLDYEKKEKEQIQLLNQSKLRFFINVSHEFRTPLTLILGNAQQLLQDGSLHSPQIKKVLGIERNVNKMNHLLNELLDFRKQEMGFANLKICDVNLCSYLREIYAAFTEYAIYKNIEYVFESEKDDIKAYIDIYQIEKAIYNILSNAFKYTREKDKISIKIEDDENTIIIRIADTGIGMSQEQCENVFVRFYQVENEVNNNVSTNGTGIGLSFAKSIVENHKGNISVTSKPGVGTEFLIQLPKGYAHFGNVILSDIIDCDRNCIESFKKPDDAFLKSIDFRVDDKRPTVLIVEDNPEVSMLLEDLLSEIYIIHVAPDGLCGYNLAIEIQPDLVISDVMMPVMSGTEMCVKLKGNILTSHIPVVLLTAKAALDYAIEGLQKGADDYISKPFNARELIVRCNNLVRGRRIVQQKYAAQADASPLILGQTQSDNELIDRLVKIIESHLDNNDFSVDDLSREIGIGRTNLYAKIKGITGMTPNNFITNIKLKKSMHLLRHTNLDIAEIAYKLGFNSSSYFIKVFKNTFGDTPTNFRKKEFVEKGKVETV